MSPSHHPALRPHHPQPVFRTCLPMAHPFHVFRASIPRRITSHSRTIETCRIGGRGHDGRIRVGKSLGLGWLRPGRETHGGMQSPPRLHERMLVPVVADPAMVVMETLRRDGETMRHGGYGVEKIMEGTWIVSFHEAIQRLRAFPVLTGHDVLQGAMGAPLPGNFTSQSQPFQTSPIFRPAFPP